MDDNFKRRRSRSNSYSPVVSDNDEPVAKHPRLIIEPPSETFIKVTDTCGNMCFVPVKQQSTVINRQHELLRSRRPCQLLAVPFHELKEKVQEIRYKKIMDATDEAMELLCEPESTSFENNLLWADKYCPKQFTELLSDDGVNRSLLSWMKLWDVSVYNSRDSLLKDTSNKQRQTTNIKKRFQNKNRFTQWDIQDPKTFATTEALDETHRPKQKIVLLHGTPGIGKTTLAHIVAVQCGYNIVEINASDDRSPDIFRKILESTTEMKCTLTSSSKPNCLIIDEIDGAPAATINVLVDVIKSTGNKKKRAKNLLSRPVICICNDLYAPSLRNLRSIAVIFAVPSTITNRLSDRLLEICRQEGVSITTSTLMSLCEKADNDIRTCLNTLQFIHGRTSDITLSTVQNATIGHKDTHRSVLSFCKDIFKIPHPKKYSNVIRDQDTELDNDKLRSRFYYMLSEASSTGDFDKVLQGIFENYLEIKIRDSNMEIVSEIQDWILFHEMLSEHVHSLQEYQFMKYMPYVSVIFHFMFATNTIGQYRIKFPHTQYETTQKLQKNQQILHHMLTDTNPIVRRNLVNPLTTAVYMIPLFLNIITPNLRPVNIQLYTKLEKELLANIVSIMLSYNVSYRQERNIDGQYTYILEPGLEELCNFSGLLQKKQLQYTTKQLLAREIEFAKVKTEVKTDKDRLTPKATTTNNKIRTKKQYDFFGRPIVLPSNEKSNEGVTACASNKRSVWFKFNEGFSDAVKKSVKIQDLL